MARISLAIVPVHTLPANLTREIGRAIVAFAKMEWLLSEMTYMLLNVEPEVGRMALGQPRATDRLGRIFDLLDLKGLPLPNEQHKKFLRATIEECQRHRDQLAHGIWGRTGRNKRPVLAIFRGTWKPSGTKAKVSRLVQPEGVYYSAEDAKSLTWLINRTIRILLKWNEELVPLVALERIDHVESRRPRSYPRGIRRPTRTAKSRAPKTAR